MRKTKIWLITATALIFIGSIIFGGVMAVFNWDFTKLSTVKYETNDYEISENYKNISVLSDTADIEFVPSNDLKTSVVCYEQKNAKHSVTVKDGTLLVKIVDTRKWYEHIGINFGRQKITVYIPQGEYGALLVESDTSDVKIPKDFRFESIDVSVSTGDVKQYASSEGKVKVKTSTGDIKVDGVTAGELELFVSTGEVTAKSITCKGDIKIRVSTGHAKLTDITCKNVTSNGSTGDISLKNVVAKEKFSIERSTGDVRFENSDAAEIFVQTDTGDVKGSLLTDKVFITETSTGNISVPKTVTGGKCEIKTDTGDINIEIK